jgi:hypothetical protein
MGFVRGALNGFWLGLALWAVIFLVLYTVFAQ